MDEFDDTDIAIIGMALRVPGARTPEQYWSNLRGGVESLQQFTDEELAARGVTPGTLADPNYVKAGMTLEGVDQFDPEFFGFSAKEAAILDPQHRQFYEVSWEALERSGHSPEGFDGAIGVFAGSGMAAYFANNILTNHDLLDSVGLFLLRHTGNDKDFLSTRVSYSFNMKGPSVNVQTACSTSLVAAHLAVQSLLSGECDMALAGGVTIDLPHGVGYHYKEGEILSPDGHCRAFDHRSKGTVFGSGTGVVVLRRLADAIADGDHIHAVIKGSAVNNDGSGKVGYLAPSVEGQSAAVAEALAVADITADTLGYVECHGTGTPVGDPIEIAALTRAFRETTDKVGFCRVGSVKSNIGHLDTAAGVAGLIKAALSIEHAQIPPTLNFEAPNPKIEFAGSPFVVASELHEWSGENQPRRAAINSLGVGGTNAFVILEQAPAAAAAQPSETPEEPATQMMVLSARSRKALDGAAEKLIDWFEANPDQPLADVAYTLHKGRFGFDQRRVFAARTPKEAAELLRENNARRIFTHTRELDRASLVFMYPGGGAQYFQMGRGLYDAEPVFKEHIDHGLELLRTRFNADLSGVFFAEDADREQTEIELAKPSVQLPLTFLVEYALTKLWEHYGIRPEALIGHSMGENTAACVAGVISFVDALGLVLLRGQLMDEVPSGGMLSVSMPASELRQQLGDELDLAAANSPQLSVASGDVAKLDELATRLEAQGIESQRVKINIAAHSRLLEGILERFRAYLESIELSEPQLPIISNRTGGWLDPADARSPQYWVDHLRNTVLYADGIATLLEDEERVFLEVGPGAILSSFTRQNPDAPTQRVFGSLRHPEDTIRDDAFFRTILGRLWAVGIDAETEKLWPGSHQRVPLPTYAFQHGSYWIEPGAVGERTSREVARPMRLENREDWLRQPHWVQQGFLAEPIEPCKWLVFRGRDQVADALVERLRGDGHTVVCVNDGDTYARVADHEFTIAPEAGGVGYSELIEALRADELLPERIVHSWLLTQDRSFRPGSSFFHRNQEYGFYSLFYLARALSKAGIEDPTHMTVIANGSCGVAGEDVPYPDKSTALGPCRVIPREFANITCSFVDVALPDLSFERKRGRDAGEQARAIENAIADLTQELAAPAATETIAWRNGVRWERRIGRPNASVIESQTQRLKKGGVYMITGGLGGIGKALATWLANEYQAKLVLLGRTPLPKREDWSEWLEQNAASDSISRSIAAIRKLEASGAEVLPIAADVTVAEQMQDALEEAETKFEHVDGVFHAAGVIRDSLIAMKSQRDVEEVFSAKVYGTLVLDELFAERGLDFMVLFSSSSAFIAPQGQIDYVGANAFMNAFAQSCQGRRDYPVTAVNWGIWADVGMVAPAAQHGDGADADIAHASPKKTKHPIFAQRYFARDGVVEQHVLTGELSASDDWVMNEHRLGSGEALLPGTGYLELIRASMAEIFGEETSFKLSNLVFDNPLYVPDGEKRSFRVRLRNDDAQWHAEILTQIPAESGPAQWRSCAAATLVREAADDAYAFICMEDIERRCHGELESAGGTSALRTTQEAHLDFGPRWRVLKRIAHGDSEAIARLRLADEFVEDLDHYKLHPGLLDIATGCAMKLIPGYADQDVAQNLWVPITYRGFTYRRPLQQEVVSWLRVSEDSSMSSGFAAFDVVIADKLGNVLAEVHQLRLRRLEGALSLQANVPGNEMPTDAEGAQRQPDTHKLSPGEQALQHNLSQGIRATEGIAALHDLLASPMPSELIVSSMELSALSEQLDSIARAASDTSSTKFERPELDSDFEPPRNATEKALAEIWGGLLGVDGIGIHDSFFDLGGHSLIAVRLFNEIADRFGADLPMSVLMSAPTIAGLGELVGDTEEDESGEQTAPAKPALQYEYVVPMHTGPVGGATPLFVVAGMFGNVLNLSHLAHLLGEERPFYAIQARGLYGDAKPHESFEDMARDYIAELRKVQPHGPYLLGGFSGGGITAYEMARQLIADGEEVEQLILLDTPLPSIAEFSVTDRASMFWQKLRAAGPQFLVDRFQARREWNRQQAERARALVPASTPGGQEFQSQQIGDAFMRAVQNYEMPNVSVDIALFRPKLAVEYRLSGGRMVNADREFIYPDNGWTPYVRSVNVYEVPGNHDSMVLEPNVRVLVSNLRSSLREADV